MGSGLVVYTGPVFRMRRLAITPRVGRMKSGQSSDLSRTGTAPRLPTVPTRRSFFPFWLLCLDGSGAGVSSWRASIFSVLLILYSRTPAVVFDLHLITRRLLTRFLCMVIECATAWTDIPSPVILTLPHQTIMTQTFFTNQGIPSVGQGLFPFSRRFLLR